MIIALATPANRILFWLLILLLIAVLAEAATGWFGFALTARAAFISLCVIGAGALTIREQALLAGALAASIVAWWFTTDIAAMLSALDLAAFFAAFIAALTVMRDVAARSRSILAVGRYLTQQPPGRRFYATAIGGHALGVFLNFGAVSLMSPLIQESAKRVDGTTNADLERRQLSALIRGFAWVLLWAPTTLTQVILLSIFTEVTWSEIAPLGIGTAAAFILLGRLYDRFEWRGVIRTGPATKPPLPRTAFLVVCGVCALLIGTTVVGSAATGASIALVLMFVAPLVTVIWFVAQGGPASVRSSAERLDALHRLLTPSAPSLVRSAVALGLSGYIGRCLGQALPVDTIAQTLDIAALPGWLFLSALPVVISLGGQIALSPILLVVLLGELLRGVETLPTGQAQILYALSVGWALSMTASPNATATLLISATTRIAPTILTWTWNLRYGLLCYVCVILVFVIVA